MNPPAARPFSADELQALRDRYAMEGAAILAQEMGRSYAVVKAKANRLGMKTIKPPLHV